MRGAGAGERVVNRLLDVSLFEKSELDPLFEDGRSSDALEN
jgi:hypothetical protein